MTRFGLIVMGVFFFIAPVEAGLEGGLTTTSTGWTRTPVVTMIPPDEATRKAELKEREKDMAAQMAALRERLKRTPRGCKGNLTPGSRRFARIMAGFRS